MQSHHAGRVQSFSTVARRQVRTWRAACCCSFAPQAGGVDRGRQRVGMHGGFRGGSETTHCDGRSVSHEMRRPSPVVFWRWLARAVAFSHVCLGISNAEELNKWTCTRMCQNFISGAIRLVVGLQEACCGSSVEPCGIGLLSDREGLCLGLRPKPLVASLK